MLSNAIRNPCILPKCHSGGVIAGSSREGHQASVLDGACSALHDVLSFYELEEDGASQFIGD
jgi:hypothetical protein